MTQTVACWPGRLPGVGPVVTGASSGLRGAFRAPPRPRGRDRDRRGTSPRPGRRPVPRDRRRMAARPFPSGSMSPIRMAWTGRLAPRGPPPVDIVVQQRRVSRRRCRRSTNDAASIDTVSRHQSQGRLPVSPAAAAQAMIADGRTGQHRSTSPRSSVLRCLGPCGGYFWGVAAYAASKAALLQLTRSLALEWARYGIARERDLCPGYIETELNRDFLRPATPGRRWPAHSTQRRLVPALVDLDGALPAAGLRISAGGVHDAAPKSWSMAATSSLRSEGRPMDFTILPPHRRFPAPASRASSRTRSFRSRPAPRPGNAHGNNRP